MVWLLAVLMLISSLHTPAAAALEDGGNGPSERYASWWDYGWLYRLPITIDNTNNAETLKDFQIFIKLDTQALVTAGKMRVDRGDLRFADQEGKKQLAYYMENESCFWVRVPSIPSRSSAIIYAYYGNASATSVSSGEATFEFFDDFEAYNDGTNIPNWQEISGDWILTTPPGKSRAVRLDDTGSSAALIRSASYSGARIVEADIADDVSGNNPHPGIIVGYQDASNYNAIYWRSTTAELVRWQVSGGTERGIVISTGLSGGVLNTYHRMRATIDASGNVVNINFLSYNANPGFSVQTTGVGLWQHRNNDEVGWCDNFRVRKYTPVEPAVRIGQEERSVRFTSFSVTPSLLNEGEPIEISATFENPAPDEIKIRVSLHDGESFEGSREICATELPLAPQAETEVSFKWIPEGGSHTLWLAIMGTPLASRTIYVNRYPVLSPIMDQVASQGKNFKLLIFAEDADGDRLNWSEDCPLFNITPRGPQ
ncbi:MAG: DUF2341 domain-containing protein, partial [Thermoplasmata archaeon]